MTVISGPIASRQASRRRRGYAMAKAFFFFILTAPNEKANSRCEARRRREPWATCDILYGNLSRPLYVRLHALWHVSIWTYVSKLPQE